MDNFGKKTIPVNKIGLENQRQSSPGAASLFFLQSKSDLLLSKEQKLFRNFSKSKTIKELEASLESGKLWRTEKQPQTWIR
jgi:hypothetical protein